MSLVRWECNILVSLKVSNMRILSALFLYVLMTPFSFNAFAERGADLYEKLSYVDEINPSIITNLKYQSANNFTGKPVQKESEGRALLTTDAATALSHVQNELVNSGYSLVLYNAYYPKQTYKKLESWTKRKGGCAIKKNKYYPNLNKPDLLSIGYIKDKLAHSRGSTVDVTIIPEGGKLFKKHRHIKTRSYKNLYNITYIDDGTIDMGTSYDTFDPLSAQDNELIPEKAKTNRAILKKAMRNHGFVQNDKVWWQFTLCREPYADTIFDFD
jgi:zinc D-Ala-D-Ala dipeptidase